MALLDSALLVEEIHKSSLVLFQHVKEIFLVVLKLDSAIVAFYAACFLAVVVWWNSLVSDNVSQIDKVWSIVPVVSAGYFVFIPIWRAYFCGGVGFVSIRALLIFLVILVWGIRLSFNYWKKGGYSVHAEDYRWPVVRKLMGAFFPFFNIFYISLMQSFLLIWLATPLYFLVSNDSVMFNNGNVDFFIVILNETGFSFHLNSICFLSLYDFIILFLLGLFLILETVADQQQWNFQLLKKKLLKTRSTGVVYLDQVSNNENLTHSEIVSRVGSETLPDAVKDGFISSGLFQYSRHPNYLCEILFWWVVYACSHVNFSWNWTMVGCSFLTLLFQGSAQLQEKLTLEKYPSYAEYQNSTSKFIFYFPGYRAGARVAKNVSRIRSSSRSRKSSKSS